MPIPNSAQLTNARISACFAPDAEGCWGWGMDGKVLTWAGGETIAFREEVVDILDRLTGQGWPSFGAIVLVLAACRGGWRETANRELTRAKDLVGEAARRESTVMLWFGRAVHGLDVISSLPEERRSGPAAKAVLIGRVCAAVTPRWDVGSTPALLAALRAGCPPEVLRPRTQPWWPTLRGEIYALAIGLAELDAAALATSERTGVEQPPAIAELPGVTAEQVRTLLAELSGDSECSGVARLARELLAAAQVPRRLEDPDALPTGGYSDIGNRGTPDRLLVGELANDDLVLAVRLALNEALYLRREVPPRTPIAERHLLIDTGIRLWGTARLVAVAAALALAATTHPGAQIRAWRAAGTRALPVDLGTRTGVVDLLAELEPAAHPGAALVAWLNSDQTPGERIIVSHPRAISDPGFRSAWIAVGSPGLFAAAVDDQGSFRLLALGDPGDRTLTEATLDLARLLAPTGVRTGRRESGRIGLNAIERIEPFPLRVPHLCRREQCWDLGAAGVVCALPDGRCTWWDLKDSGPIELTSGLPEGRPLLIDECDGAFRIVMHGKPANRLTLCIISRTGALSKTVLGEQLEIRVVLSLSGDIVAVLRDRIMVYRSDGALAAEHRLGADLWFADRFFRNGRVIRALDWDGQRILLIPIPEIQQINLAAHRHLELFDRQALDGPWWTVNGTTFQCSGKADSVQLELPKSTVPKKQMGLLQEPLWKVLDKSRDGHRVLIHEQVSKRRMAFDLKTRKPTFAPAGLLEPALHACNSLANGMLARIRSLTVSGESLGMITLKNAVHLLVADGEGITWRVSLSPIEHMRIIELQPVGTKRRPRWEGVRNGISAEIDSRGMLHLRDATSSLPELAVVLRAGRTAVWSSNGSVCGPIGYVGDVARSPATKLLDLLRRYAERLA